MVQENSLKNKIIIICGPTASSKTALAVKCAELLETEVISADSMYIYKNLDIGTAKPDVVEMNGIKHHLIDVALPTDVFSVSDYKKLAEPILQDLLSKGKTPIICGGTGFYINSLLYDLSYGNGSSDLAVRNKYKLLAEKEGNLAVYKILQDLDPESAEKLHFNDLKRVIRALEIYENGKKKSEIADSFEPKYNYNAYCIDYPRDVLYERIHSRIEQMISNGLIEEVKNLIKSGITIENQCMQGIGYKEIYSYLNNEISLETAIEQLKINTRHYAKRQITFFKRLPNLTYLQPEPIEILAKRIISDL